MEKTHWLSYLESQNTLEEPIMLLNEKEIMKNMTIKESDNSPILIAKRELIVSEKKIVLLDEMTTDEMKIMKTMGYKGGIIL